MLLKELRSKEEILTEVSYLATGALLGNLLTRNKTRNAQCEEKKTSLRKKSIKFRWVTVETIKYL